MKFIPVILIIFAVTTFSQSDSSNSKHSDSTNNLIVKPRVLFGIGMSTPVEKYKNLFSAFGNFNLRVVSDEESWTRREISMFVEFGICYITESIAESEGNGIPYYFRFGPEIKIFSTWFLCPSFGFLGVANPGPEAGKTWAIAFGLSLNHSVKLNEKLYLELEGGTNLLPDEEGYPIYTPYIAVGLSLN